MRFEKYQRWSGVQTRQYELRCRNANLIGAVITYVIQFLTDALLAIIQQVRVQRVERQLVGTDRYRVIREALPVALFAGVMIVHAKRVLYDVR
jgi:hypothetical protein